MKKLNLKKILTVTVLVSIFTGFTACDPQGTDKTKTENPNIIKITDANSLVKALQFNPNDFVYDDNATQSSRAISEDKQNKLEIDIVKQLKTYAASNSSFLILNAISISKGDFEFDKDITLNISEIPEFMKTYLKTVGLTEDYIASTYNGAIIRMHKYADSEYDIIFKYVENYGPSSQSVISYIYVIGDSSDNLVTWYCVNTGMVWTKRAITENESLVEIKVKKDGSDCVYYEKIGFKDSKNFYEKIIRDNNMAVSKKYVYYNVDKGFIWNQNREKQYFGLSETKPSMLCLNVEFKKPEGQTSASPYYSNFYINTYYLNDKNTEKPIFETNYYEYLHDNNIDNGTRANYASDPLYYTKNEKFYGVIGTGDDLNPEAKAVYTELSSIIEAWDSDTFDYSSYKADSESDYQKVLSRRNIVLGISN